MPNLFSGGTSSYQKTINEHSINNPNSKWPLLNAAMINLQNAIAQHKQPHQQNLTATTSSTHSQGAKVNLRAATESFHPAAVTASLEPSARASPDSDTNLSSSTAPQPAEPTVLSTTSAHSFMPLFSSKGSKSPQKTTHDDKYQPNPSPEKNSTKKPKSG